MVLDNQLSPALLSRGIGPDELQQSLSTPTVLWFCDLECPGNLAGSTDTSLWLLGPWDEILTHTYSKSTEAYLTTQLAVKHFHQTFYPPPAEFGFSDKIQEVRNCWGKHLPQQRVIAQAVAGQPCLRVGWSSVLWMSSTGCARISSHGAL